MGTDFSQFVKIILSGGHLFSEHAGLSGTNLRRVGPVQYALHWLYGVSEPTILRIVDFILRQRLLTETRVGRCVLYLIAVASRYFPHGIVVTTAAAGRMVDFVLQMEGPRGARLAVGPCVCQRALNRWEEPVKKDMVILYGADIYYNLNIGYELISAEEGKKLLKECEDAGLVHVIDFCMRSGKWAFVICNCENRICAPTRVYLYTGQILFPGPEIVAHNRQLCLGPEKCGRCIKRCIFGVNFENDGRVDVNYAKCMGCGLCVTTCPAGARMMIERGDYRHDHQIPSDILLGVRKPPASRSK
ncbi:MAG: 4Fe-4S binding protein [Deltaproteobacteria bacterium]|nr:4Fe-4S binding protein [Deltaproteobacteria bacterium]